MVVKINSGPPQPIPGGKGHNTTMKIDFNLAGFGIRLRLTILWLQARLPKRRPLKPNQGMPPSGTGSALQQVSEG